MIYNLKDLFLNSKFNIRNFEELSFANSNISMPKNMLGNVYFASDNKENQNISDINSEIPNAVFEVEEKETLFSRIKKKISDFFKPKPQTYRLGNGESLELDGEMPGNPVAGFFSRLGSKIENLVNKPKEIKEGLEVINKPEVYSDYPTTVNEKKQEKDPSLLADGSRVPKENIIIPKEVDSQRKAVDSLGNPVPTVEKIDMDKEEVFKEKKEEIAAAIDSLTAEKEAPAEPTAPVAPIQDTVEHDDFDK